MKNNKNKLYKTEKYYNDEKNRYWQSASHTIKSVIIILVIICILRCQIISIYTNIVENMMTSDIDNNASDSLKSVIIILVTLCIIRSQIISIPV